jgi:hypothetical protein
MSTLKVNNITDTSGGSTNLTVPNTAKAWVNFNGTGTVAIRAQYNVSSITDNGTGDYTVNFTTALADVNYSATSSGSLGAAFGTLYTLTAYSYSATSVSVQALSFAGAGVARLDFSFCNVAIFR